MNIILFDEPMSTYQPFTATAPQREIYNITKGTLRLPDSACVWLPRRMAGCMQALCEAGKNEFITQQVLAGVLWGPRSHWPMGWYKNVMIYVSTTRRAFRDAGLLTQIRTRYEWGYYLEPMPLVEP